MSTKSLNLALLLIMAVACAGATFGSASLWRAHQRNAAAPAYAARILAIGSFVVFLANLALYFFVWNH